MAFDTVTHSKKKNLIVHDAIGYVYLLSLNQVSHGYFTDLTLSILTLINQRFTPENDMPAIYHRLNQIQLTGN